MSPTTAVSAFISLRKSLVVSCSVVDQVCVDPSLFAELLLQPEALLSTDEWWEIVGKIGRIPSGKLITFQGPLWMRVPVVAIVSFGGSDKF